MKLPTPILKIRRKLYEQNIIKSVRRNTKKINNSRDLSTAQEKEIEQYWRNLIGIKVPLDWHRYFYKRTGVYSVQYIPTSLYFTDIIGRANQMNFARAYSDKNVTETLLKGVRHPQTVVKNMNGYFFDNEGNISKERAIEICSNLEDVIIKPSMLSHGDGVKKFSCTNGQTSVEGKSIEQLFDSYKTDFIIQKVVHQHERMNALNPSSVNTVRVLTYHSGMEVLVPYTVIRIGRKGWDIDNETAGGISTKINPDGTLCKYAYGAPGNDMIEKTDTGVTLEGYAIPSFDKVIETAQRLHLQLPHFNLIGWDMCIDEDGEPVLIEWNVWPELSQSANGPAFGQYTERIIKEIWGRKNSRPF